MEQGPGRRGPRLPAALEPVCEALWPGRPAAFLTRRPHVPTGSRDYLAVPRTGAPQWLLPVGRPDAVVALAGPGVGRARRLVLHLAAALLRLAPLLPVRRLRVPLDGSVPRTLTPSPDDAVAVRVRDARRTGSVVLRCLAPDGTTSAFAKVALDDRGRAAVRAEVDALRTVGALRLERVVLPSVLREVTGPTGAALVLSPLTSGAEQPPDALPVAAMAELAGHGRQVVALSRSPWRSDVTARLRGLPDSSGRRTLARALDVLDSTAGHLAVPVGPSHGDWTDWNMCWDGDRVLLWDWEHFATGVPAGFDLAHFLAQRARVRRGTDRAAEDGWGDEVRQALGAHAGLDRDQSDAVVLAYLVEVNLRYLRDRVGTPDEDRPRDGWGTTLLDREAARRGHA